MTQDPQDQPLDEPANEPIARRNFYGRTHGHTLRPSQRRYLAEDLDRLRLHGVTAAENPDRRVLDLDFRHGRPLWLEVGFGGGEHLVHMAALYPHVHLIGAEPYVNGVAMLLGRLRRRPLANLSLHPGDVRDLLDVLPDACIARAFVNYPDPWPKARHHRRRFVTQEHLVPLFRVMAPGAELRLATDIADYVRQALEEVPRAGFVLMTRAEGDAPWDDWPSTRYEKKARRAGRLPHYLGFRRP